MNNDPTTIAAAAIITCRYRHASKRSEKIIASSSGERDSSNKAGGRAFEFAELPMKEAQTIEETGTQWCRLTCSSAQALDVFE